MCPNPLSKNDVPSFFPVKDHIVYVCLIPGMLSRQQYAPVLELCYMYGAYM